MVLRGTPNVHLCPGPGRPDADRPHRIALLSMHTSPLHQPGTGDSGGMNVYIVQAAKRLAARGVAVDIFTRATTSSEPPVAQLADGVRVRHVPAGPYEGLTKTDLPAQLCAFTAGILRAEAARPAGWYDLVHSHYWLSGQAGYLVADRWGVPMVHTAHTLGRVKNAQLADGDRAEPATRIIGEDQVVAESDRLVANTAAEADDLIRQYGAEPGRVSVVLPGVDLECFTPGDRFTAAGPNTTADLRRRHDLPTDALIVLFVGRIQPLKAPDVLLRALARLRDREAALGRPVVAVVAGGASGTATARPDYLRGLAAELGVTDRVRFLPAQPGARLAELYRCADLVCVPSHNESFGLVALEAQACGTPVVAAAVGGLTTAVRHDETGVLVDGHDPQRWATVLGELLAAPDRRAALAAAGVDHARRFSWDRTADGLLDVYTDAIGENRRRTRACA
ncbi:D-inositol-3-phosphate glycosyltransferase [Actinocatenispora thailandica]|uniref:D-inositol-3-phosphate glycosyltransferase n=1 Tax=Actinocatenispora thailandica TaxID=227318 RepID=A0A7R7DUW6_9ACTN|nr:D-inositol-3-phosphate glycosyltransferase [Actinocatenispora thailandica]BCJ38150.1 D-inositol-3-phosphate glycosyltransferase [Actinocatenispora thailandica]